MENTETIERKSGAAVLVKRLVRRIVCFFRGHPCDPTGRHAILLMEWKCKRCGGIYVSHAHHGNALIDADDDSDRIFRDCMDVIKGSDAYPPNVRVSDRPE